MRRDYPAIRRFIETGNPGPRMRPTPTEIEAPTAPTPRQLEVFKAIYESARDLGYQPTLRELMERFGHRSSNGISGFVRALRRKGYLGPAASSSWKSRSFRILRRPDGSPFTGFAEKD